MLGATRCVFLIKEADPADPLGGAERGPTCVFDFSTASSLLYFRLLGALLFLYTPIGHCLITGDTKSVSADDSHPLIDVPFDYPELTERIPSMASGGVQPDLQAAYKGRGASVEPATLVKVEGSGSFWFREKTP